MMQDYLRAAKLCNELAELFERLGHLSMSSTLRHMAAEMKPMVDEMN